MRRGLTQAKKNLFTVVVCLLALFVVEVTMRIMLPPLWSRMLHLRELGKQANFECLRISETTGFEAIPGRCGRNELGLMVLENPARPKDARRILLLGDSLSDHATLGNASYVVQMQRLLDESGSRRGWEIWNGAVTGYNLFQEFRVLRETFDAVRPSLILFQLCPNDFYSRSEVVFLDEQTRLRFLNPDGSMNPRFLALAHFRILDYLFFSVYGERIPKDIRGQSVKTEKLLAQIRDFAGERKVPVAFLIFPHFGESPKEPFYEDYQGLLWLFQGSDLRHFLGEQALDPPLKAYRRADFDPIHPNAKAHAQLGLFFFEELSRAGFFQ